MNIKIKQQRKKVAGSIPTGRFSPMQYMELNGTLLVALKSKVFFKKRG